MDGSEKHRARILLVEDDDLSRWAVRRYLEKRGFGIIETPDGRRALDHLTRQAFDIVVTDLMIGDISGLELTAYVQKNCPDTQVIVITGKGSKESAINALRHGVFDYIEKPFELERLLIAIEKALEKTSMAQELVRLSRTDGLTGLHNQRYFYEVLACEMKRCRRLGRCLSIILADVDSFKEYNDRYGHLGGDEVLVKIARCLREACRGDVDKAFRYGGDEFILILPEADLQAARSVSLRIRDLVASLGLEGISLSIGLAELEAGQDLKTFIRHADEAMYLAKQMGGNYAMTFSTKA